MQINIMGCLFVLDSEKNENIRKNDIKKIKVLLDNQNELPTIAFTGNDIKEEIRKHLHNIIGTNMFHLEQVFTMNHQKEIDIIYLGITNISYVNKKLDNYKLVDFSIKDNHIINLDNKSYEYKTKEKQANNNIEYIHEIKEKQANNNIEYIHEIKEKDENTKRILEKLLYSYKRIRSNIDNTDIIFKFMGPTFTLEDVRIVYELIKDCSVDKSNFRKKIIKYCEKTESKEKTKNGFRPSQTYKFKPLIGDIWI